MKSKVNYLKRFATAAVALLFACSALFSDGEATEVYMTGSSNTTAGDYVVTGTDDVYHFS